jgi:hypothetical protein
MITVVTIETIRNEENVVNIIALETGGENKKKKTQVRRKKEHIHEGLVGEES